MAFEFNTDETSTDLDSIFLMEAGRCDNGCIWNSEVHSRKTQREVELEKALDVKTCRKCNNSSPDSLRALCRSKIISSEKLVKMACVFLPPFLIPPLMQHAARRLDALKDLQMESIIRILIEHWPFRVLDVSMLTRRVNSVKLVRKLTVDRFLETISSGNLMNELVASDCDDFISYYETMDYYRDTWEYSSFLEYIRKRAEEVVINEENLKRKYILRTNVMVRSSIQIAEYVQHIRFFQRENSPFDIRIVKIVCAGIKMTDILELFSVIDPKYVESLCLTFRHLNVKVTQDLEAKLREFQSLSTLLMDLGVLNLDPTLGLYDMSGEISTLLGRHLQGITRLHLKVCPTFGHLERLRLPMNITELRMWSKYMKVDDYEQFANLYHFPILTRFSLNEFHLCDGLIRFIGNHSSTLTKLEMTFAKDHDSSQMKALADHLRRFGILQDFTYSFGFQREDFSEILREFV